MTIKELVERLLAYPPNIFIKFSHDDYSVRYPLGDIREIVRRDIGTNHEYIDITMGEEE